jgi:hypothetical protein
MTCPICDKPNLRRVIELSYGAKMSAADIAQAFGGVPSTATINRHVRDHLNTMDLPTRDPRTTKQRVQDLQLMMLDMLEARIQKAEEMAARARDNGDVDVLPSDFFDPLKKDNQAAINSILKMQDQADRREGKKATVAVDLMRLMGGTAPPSHLIEDGQTIEGEVVEVDETAS